MTKNTKILTICLAVVVFFVSISIFERTVSGAELNDEQITQVKNNCVSARATLNQLHASDALLRVNSGQIYESLATKLMKKFNTRVSSNHYGNSTLVSITSNYESTLNTFRQDYILYEEQLTKTLSVDCSKEPVLFYDSVASARIKRAMVYADISRINQYIEDYKSAVAQLKLDYQAVNNGAKQ